MKKIILLATAAVFLMTGTGFSKMGSGSSGNNYKMPHGKWWKVPAVREELKITGKEEKKLDRLYTESRRKMIDLKASVEKAQLDLDLILDAKTFDKKAAMKQFRALEEAKTGLATERFDFITEARILFGQERFSKICTKRKDFMRRGYHKTGPDKCPAGKRMKNRPVDTDAPGVKPKQ